jgi:cytochrome oxidase Cu insertion factor (SCO1/SenC/PrrC family)
MVHSTNFLLVDQQGWIRKIYGMEEVGLVESVVEDILGLVGT